MQNRAGNASVETLGGGCSSLKWKVFGGPGVLCHFQIGSTKLATTTQASLHLFQTIFSNNRFMLVFVGILKFLYFFFLKKKFNQI